MVKSLSSGDSKRLGACHQLPWPCFAWLQCLTGYFSFLHFRDTQVFTV